MGRFVTVIYGALFASGSIWELGSSARADDFVIETQWNGGNCGNCEWLFIGGHIPADAGERYQRFFSEHPYSLHILINSPGGNVVGAMELGRQIRKNSHRSIGIGGEPDSDPNAPESEGSEQAAFCLSACIFAFIGGEYRLADQNEIGVHQLSDVAYDELRNEGIYSPQDLADRRKADAIVVSYLEEMGVSSALFARMAETPPNEMAYLSREELRAFRVISDPLMLSEWSLEPHQGGLISHAETPGDESRVTIFCREPGKLTVTINTSQTYNYFDESLDEFGGTILGRQILGEDVTVTHADGSALIEAPIGQVGAVGDEPTRYVLDTISNEYFEGFGFNPKGFAENLQILSKNCVE